MAGAVGVIFLCSFVVTGFVSETAAQNVNQAVVLEDLGFTFSQSAGARPSGLAGAYFVIGNDVHSVVFNPAGLAKIKRIELSLEGRQEYYDTSNEFFGTKTSVSGRNGGLESLAAAYPFPTYRGSLVAAFGVYRVYSSFLDIGLGGKNTRTETIDDYLLQQSGSLFSYNVGLGVDLSPVLSGGFSLFVLRGTVEALTQYDYTALYTIPRTSVFLKQDVKVNLHGYGARIGGQYFLHKNVVGGFAFATPVWITTSGDTTKEFTRYEDNDRDDFAGTVNAAEDEYLLPYRFDAGLAFTTEPVTAVVEFSYHGWGEAAVNRKRFRDPNTAEPIFHGTFDYRAALEYSLPWYPVQLRAGYAYLGYPLEYLQVERIDYRPKYLRGYRYDSARIEKADIDNPRQQFSVGAGGALGSAMAVNAAYVHTSGGRSTVPLIDERSVSRFVFGLSYKF